MGIVLFHQNMARLINLIIPLIIVLTRKSVNPSLQIHLCRFYLPLKFRLPRQRIKLFFIWTIKWTQFCFVGRQLLGLLTARSVFKTDIWPRLVTVLLHQVTGCVNTSTMMGSRTWSTQIQHRLSIKMTGKDFILIYQAVFVGIFTARDSESLPPLIMVLSSTKITTGCR